MQLTYDELRISYQSDEQLARALYAMLVIQETKLELIAQKLANEAQRKRREYRG